MKTESKVLEVRVGYDSVPYTFWQRTVIWFEGIKAAVWEMPPTHWSRPKDLYPGDPGYETAFLIVQRKTFIPSLTRAGVVALTPEDLAKLGEENKSTELSELNHHFYGHKRKNP